MNYGPLVINVDYPDDLLRRNLSLVCFVVRRSNTKVERVAVVEREALPVWYTNMVDKHSPNDFMYILSTTSVVGEIVDLIVHPKDDETKAATVN